MLCYAPGICGWWASKRVADLDLNSPITITPDVTCKEAIEVMNSNAFDMVPVQSAEDGQNYDTFILIQR